METTSSEQDYLLRLTMHGIKLGLDNIRFLLDTAGSPQDRYPTVHVAGTNGKGSVLAFLDAMFRAAGYRVGKFTSPHLIHPNERFQIGGIPIGGAELDAIIARFRQIAEGLEQAPTFFEVNTAVAFEWFANLKVDVALIEVGMGGRLDSTNVITPVATAITNIDLEHTAYLGDTLSAIAGEKAGILKPGIPAIITETRDEPLQVLLRTAAERGSPVHLLDRDFTFDLTGEPWAQQFEYRDERGQIKAQSLGLAGRHQGSNAACAVALARQLQPVFPRLTDAHIQQGLVQAKWPGRLDRVMNDPPVIIDVAHNVAGAQRLVETVKSAVTVLSVSSDKDAAGMIRLLAPISKRLILTTFSGWRSMPLERLKEAAGDAECEAVPDLRDALRTAIGAAAKRGRF
jgi:dihydrofolate synthase/folylpolyglutamate synthase